MNDFVREFFEDQPELLRRYERNEARYILQLPKNYDTISIDFGIDKNELKRLVIALAELDLTIDEWLCFKMKELILADRLSKENRGRIRDYALLCYLRCSRILYADEVCFGKGRLLFRYNSS